MEQPKIQEMEFVVLPAPLANAITSYLGDKPHKEVSSILDAMKNASTFKQPVEIQPDGSFRTLSQEEIAAMQGNVPSVEPPQPPEGDLEGELASADAKMLDGGAH